MHLLQYALSEYIYSNDKKCTGRVYLLQGGSLDKIQRNYSIRDHIEGFIVSEGIFFTKSTSGAAYEEQFIGS